MLPRADSDSMCHGTVLSAEKPLLESLDSSTAICQGPEFSFRHLLELELHHFSPETSVTWPRASLNWNRRNRWSVRHSEGFFSLCHVTISRLPMAQFASFVHSPGMLSTTLWTKAWRRPKLLGAPGPGHCLLRCNCNCAELSICNSCNTKQP